MSEDGPDEERIEAALGWIVRILDGLDVPFQVVGGLAARAHGATRPLLDIDIYVPSAHLDAVRQAVQPRLTRPPAPHRDEHWDLEFMQLEYEGQIIEIAAADGARYRDRESGGWWDAGVAFDAGVASRVFGVEVPVMPREQLLAYKRRLGRPVDLADVAELEGLTFREAGDEDVPELAHLYADSVRSLGPTGYGPDAVAAWASFAGTEEFRDFILAARTLVVEDGSGVVGFGGVDESGRIPSLYVRGDRARRGIGSRLLARLLEMGREDDVRRFRAEASVLSRPLFERFGFRVVENETVERGGIEIRRYRMEMNT